MAIFLTLTINIILLLFPANSIAQEEYPQAQTSFQNETEVFEYQGSIDQIKKLYDRIHIFLKREDITEEDINSFMKDFLYSMNNLGMKRNYYFSYLIGIRAIEFAEVSKVKNRDALITAGKSLGDDYPGIYLLSMKAGLKSGLNNIPFVLLDGIRFIALQYKNPFSLLNIAGNIMYRMTYVILIFSFLIAALLFYKYSPFLHHIITEYLTPIFPVRTTYIIVILFTFLPLFLGAGLGPSIMYVIAVYSIFAGIKERLLGIICMFLLSITPALSLSSSKILACFERDDYRLLEKYHTGLWDEIDYEKIFSDAEKDKRIAFFSALLHQMRGEFAKARILYQNLSKEGFNLSKVLNNYGIVSYIQGDKTKAMEMFKASIENDHLNPEAHYNLAIYNFREGNLTEGKDEMDKATAIDETLLERYIKTSTPQDKGEKINFSIFVTSELDPQDLIKNIYVSTPANPSVHLST